MTIDYEKLLRNLLKLSNLRFETEYNNPRIDHYILYLEKNLTKEELDQILVIYEEERYKLNNISKHYNG